MLQRHTQSLCWVTLFLYCLLLTPVKVLAAPELETFVLSVGGQSFPSFPNPPAFSCATFGTPPEIFKYFGANVSIPSEGLSQCSIQGSMRGLTASSGTLVDSNSVNATFNSGANTYNGNAQAKARHGQVGVNATGTFTGLSNSGIVEGSAALATFRETFTLTSPLIPNGTSSNIAFKFTIDGNMSVVGGLNPFAGVADIETGYKLDSGPFYTLMRSQLNGSSGQPFFAVPVSTYGAVNGPGNFGGYTLSAGKITGNGTFDTFFLPFTWGTPFDLTFAMLVYVIPSPNSTTLANFYSTATLSAISPLDGTGKPVKTFTVSSASGTSYDTGGLRIDDDGDGVSLNEGDCNDSNPSIHPGASEICNGLDDNCNGLADESVTDVGKSCSTGLLGVCSSGINACTGGTLICTQSQSASAEICDSLDNNCNGFVDEGLDADGDGVKDCLDTCPSDPAKSTPGICGCGTLDIDSDGDGIANCKDLCPANIEKSAPGICGCSSLDTDSDGDGTPNCKDQCPSDSGKIFSGLCGCGTPDTDSDSDGTPDCKDQCPVDASKTLSGLCGCGTPDSDSDSDGTVNCLDQCPSDASKIAAGICGCGIVDADSDGDSVADCKDLCPSDKNKTTIGICGCGISDSDANGNGVADCNDLLVSNNEPPAPTLVQRNKVVTVRLTPLNGFKYVVTYKVKFPVKNRSRRSIYRTVTVSTPLYKIPRLEGGATVEASYHYLLESPTITTSKESPIKKLRLGYKIDKRA